MTIKRSTQQIVAIMRSKRLNYVNFAVKIILLPFFKKNHILYGLMLQTNASKEQNVMSTRSTGIFKPIQELL